MEAGKMRDINRLKILLAEKKKTNKWLCEQLGVNPTTVLVYKFITAKFGNGSKNDGSLGCGHKSNNQSARKKVLNSCLCLKYDFRPTLKL